MKFVLVHGAWHDSRCWSRVTPLLESAGHEVFVVDLPGHGKNIAVPRELHLTHYIDYICELITALAEPLILVGHSFAGIMLSAVALRIPQYLHRLVYVAAFIPKNKESLFRIAETFPPTPLTLHLNDDQKIIDLDLDAVNLLCQDGSETDRNELRSILQAEPMLPMMEGVSLAADPCTLVPSDYIACTDDLTMPYQCQLSMIADRQFQVHELASGHSPFFSVPEQLATLLGELHVRDFNPV